MPSMVPSFDHSGLALRTVQQVLADPPSRATPRRSRQARRWRGPPRAPRRRVRPPACRTASRCALPLMRGTLTKPAAQPISAPPGKRQLGNRLAAAFGDRARAVGQPLAALEGRRDRRMCLEALEFLERRQIRIGVIEMDDKADRHQVVVVDDRGTSRRRLRRRAASRRCAARGPGWCFAGRDLPELLQPDAEFLRLATAVECEFRDQRLRQAAAGAFGEQRVFGRAVPCRG